MIRCALASLFYTLRYWLRGGVLAWTVSGHEYGEGTFSIVDNGGGYVTLTGDIPPQVEVEDYRCDRCGHSATSWRPIWSAQ